jgi:Domain of unknown function (DUF4276)
MNQVIVLVEGPTEEAFVKEVLRPYLQHHNVWITPTIINTKIVKDGKNFKGGSVYFGKVHRDLQRLLKDNSIHVTTFFDFYRLGTDFPRQNEMPSTGHVYERITFLEKALEHAINNNRFKAYIQPYEFEALLLADLNGFKNNFADEPVFIEGISQIIQAYPNPEEINDGFTTAPSKRIETLKPNFEKIFHGNMIALENGIEILLSKCPHFSNWVESLKNLPRL